MRWIKFWYRKRSMDNRNLDVIKKNWRRRKKKEITIRTEFSETRRSRPISQGSTILKPLWQTASLEPNLVFWELHLTQTSQTYPP